LVKVGILQFFSWPQRNGELSAVYARALDRIVTMDHTGYDAVWLAEHHFTSFSVCPSPHMLATIAAERTKTLRIGMAVSLAAFYHPLRLAEEIALLDVLSGGRVNWGAGRGFARQEFEAFEIPPAESAARFRETVEIVLKAWTTDRLTCRGEYFAFDDVEVLPKPTQTPHPPVWIAASSEPAIEWAAGRGFSILMDPHASHSDIARKRRLYSEILRGAGHLENGREIPIARLVAIGANDREAKEVARRGAEWLVASYAGSQHRPVVLKEDLFGSNPLDPVERYLDDVIIYGTRDSVVDQILRLQGEIALNYLLCAPLSQSTFLQITDYVLPRIS
jgi:alkanesulfonate monooxygenase SsuD/methylene tetrahydromethanopterin reductase-like flavin-dependent oxidoreductase (luciferase family)